jgi:hypothetical protein
MPPDHCGVEMIMPADIRQDERFNQLLTVTGESHLRFYCALPVIADDGKHWGLCSVRHVMDFEPRQLAFEQTEPLRRLSRQVLSRLEARRSIARRSRNPIRRVARLLPKKLVPKNFSPTFCLRRYSMSSRRAAKCS